MEKEIKKEFGQRVKTLRKQLGLSQKDFASAIDLAASYLSEIESGKIKPGFDFFYKITKEYRVNPFYLLHGEEPLFLEIVKKGPDKERAEITRAFETYFGEDYKNVRQLLLYLKHSTMARYAILENFLTYRMQKKDLLEEDLKERRIRLDLDELSPPKRPGD